MIRAVLIALAASACDPSAFEDRRDRSWSDSRGAPAAMTAADYGVAVTTVDREQPGATIVVAGAAPAGLATLSYDEDGTLDEHGLDLVGVALGLEPTLAGASGPIPGGDGVFAISSASGEIVLYDARTGALGPLARQVVASEVCGVELAELGSAMAFGVTDVGTLEVYDLVALAGTELVVFPDLGLDEEPTCVHCTLTNPAMQPAPGMDVDFSDVDLDPSDEEIVVSVAGWSAGAASVVALEASMVAAATGGPCFETPPALGGIVGGEQEPDFGGQVAVGDADGTGIPEIALAAPSTHLVYVVANAGGTGDSPQLHTIVAPAGSAGFPAALVFGDFDRDGLEELAVGDPSASPEGVEGAGQVVLFALRDGLFEATATVYDSAPVPGQAFGRSLAVAEFVVGPDRVDLLVVGARDEVFTYFRTASDVADPRR